MSINNPFVKPAEFYKRHIDPVGDYKEQAAYMLHKKTGDDIEKCRAFVSKQLNGGFKGVRNPTVTYLRRMENGDREQMTCRLTDYINETIKSREIMAPTLTTYLPPDVKSSMLVDFIDNNVKKRSRAKKAMFAAESAGDEVAYFFHDIEQRNTKLSNNAISGAHASASTPLYNQTAHSTLTSNCRMTSGFGNANNEKLLSGNRHYWSPQIVFNNIVSITTHTDYDLLKKVMEKYDLHYPSVKDVMNCITYSSDLYFYAPKKLKTIEDYVSKLSPEERAAFVYTGDLYHVRKHNDSFFRDLIARLSMKVTDKQIEDPLAILGGYADPFVNLAHQICSEEMKGRGRGMDKYKGMVGKFDDILQVLSATTVNIGKVVEMYSDFFTLIMVSDNVPASVPHFPNSIRRAALTSDTDSTIFTVQSWAGWYFGNIEITTASIAVASSMVFLAEQAIIHVLARMSINNGIEKSRYMQTAMKNEFFFPVFVPTEVSKHYFALISCQEGNVKPDFEVEIKGVHMKSSNAPKHINDAARKMMVDSMLTVARNEKISLLHWLKYVGDIERDIYAGIKKGDSDYFRLGEMKTPGSYKKEPEKSPYIHHLFWEETFGHFYGQYGAPPYQVLRAKSRFKNQTSFRKWLDDMENKELAKKIADFCVRNNKDTLGSFLLPQAIVATNGVPKEILDAIDVRAIMKDLSKTFYLILPTMGYVSLNSHGTHLVSDTY